MAFKENLRIFREQAGYATAKDFAAAVGIPYTTYINYETKGKEPRFDTLRRLAFYLHVSIDQLLDYSEGMFDHYKTIAESAGYDVTILDDGRVSVHDSENTLICINPDDIDTLTDTIESTEQLVSTICKKKTTSPYFTRGLVYKNPRDFVDCVQFAYDRYANKTKRILYDEMLSVFRKDIYHRVLEDCSKMSNNVD